jgi:hypothetical protein
MNGGLNEWRRSRERFRNTIYFSNTINKKNRSFNRFIVRAEGLEPPCLAALDPKSSASTNFATPA